MPELDVGRREARCVLVLHGPRRGGKTETLQAIRHAVPAERRGDVESCPSGVHPALVLERLRLRLCPLADLSVRLDLYAVPDHEALPLLGDLLRRADGVVFVADAQAGRVRAGREALAALEAALARAGADPALPFVFQWNKRDLPGSRSGRELALDLDAGDRPGFETVATTGEGVLAPVRDVALSVVARLGRATRAREGARPRRLFDDAVPSFVERPTRRAA
jgi:hypothetical protein